MEQSAAYFFLLSAAYPLHPLSSDFIATKSRMINLISFFFLDKFFLLFFPLLLLVLPRKCPYLSTTHSSSSDLHPLTCSAVVSVYPSALILLHCYTLLPSSRPLPSPVPRISRNTPRVPREIYMPRCHYGLWLAST